MNVLTTLAIVIPSALSLITSLIYACIALKKAKEPPKDEIWETATKLICNGNNPILGADEFADIYEQLKFFKENGCSLNGITSLSYAVSEKHKKEQQQLSEEN